METSDILFLLDAVHFDVEQIEHWSDEVVSDREWKLENVLHKLEYNLLAIRRERLRREIQRLDFGEESYKASTENNSHGKARNQRKRRSMTVEAASASNGAKLVSMRVYRTKISPPICFAPNTRSDANFEGSLESQCSASLTNADPQKEQGKTELSDDVKEELLEYVTPEQEGGQTPPAPPPGTPSNLYTLDPINGHVYEIVSFGSRLCLTTTGIMDVKETKYLFGQDRCTNQLVWVENFKPNFCFPLPPPPPAPHELKFD